MAAFSKHIRTVLSHQQRLTFVSAYLGLGSGRPYTTCLTRSLVNAGTLPGCGTLALIVVSLLSGCATRALPVSQAIEVRVEADDPAWGGPLQCQAANPAGRWQFAAPGTVTVQPSTSPLEITCKTPAGATADASTTAPDKSSGWRESARRGASAGAKVGAGAGVALGVAAAPVMGQAFAVVLAVGSVFKGAEIGGAVGAVTAGNTVAYPSPIVIRIKRASPDD